MSFVDGSEDAFFIYESILFLLVYSCLLIRVSRDPPLPYMVYICLIAALALTLPWGVYGVMIMSLFFMMSVPYETLWFIWDEETLDIYVRSIVNFCLCTLIAILWRWRISQWIGGWIKGRRKEL